MSKYVRTKDGRILKVFCENVPLSKEIDGLTYYGKNTTDLKTSHWLPKDQIFKQADTIEELCDEAVFFDKDNKPHYKSQEGNIWYLGASLFTETLRFGIFTDKGLIYVTKKNKKGKTVLL